MEIVGIIIIFFTISIIMVSSYVIYMRTKKRQYPHMKFSQYCDNKNSVSEVEQLINMAIRGVNGWMWLATVFMALYYFLNFWSIVLIMINLIMVIYEIEGYRNYTVFLTLGSILFSFLDLWLNSKEKSLMFHTHWFNTSIITKEYIVKFSNAKTFEELCTLAIEFNNHIYEENMKIKIL